MTAQHNPYIRHSHLTCQRALKALTLAVLSLLHTMAAQAADEEQTGPINVRVRVEAKPEPVRAIGILLSTNGLKEVSETSIEKVGERLYEIAFSVERSAISDDTVATAMATNAQGEATFANVTPALLSESHSITGEVPECAGEDPTSIAILNQLGPLRQLVDVRTERAKFARERVRRAIDDALMSKLGRFEKHFGLAQGKEPLSAQLPADELFDRLSRINFALAEFKTFKKAEASSSGGAK